MLSEYFDLAVLKSPDYFELKITEKQSIGIKETKGLINWLQFKPYEFDFKLACVIQAEKMTIEAQNSLLKTLEEPPSHSFVILLTPNHKRLLRTIISRSRLMKINDLEGAEDIENKTEANGDLTEILSQPLKEQVKWIEEIAKIKNPVEKKQYIYDFLEALHSKAVKAEQLHNLKLIDKTYEGLRRNVNIKLLLENLLFNYLH